MGKYLMDAGETQTFKPSSPMSVYGSTGIETFKIEDGSTGAVTFMGNSVDRIELARASTEYSYKATTTGIDVIYNGATVAKMASGQKLACTDAAVAVAAALDASGNVSFTLGAKPVTTAVVTGYTLAPTPISGEPVTTVLPPSSASGANVFAAGTSDASTANMVYTIAAGTYTYSIAGFGAGDKLSFPAGNVPSVSNDSFTDGVVDLTWSYGGNAVTIHLTGISAANEALLNSSANFNTVFGTGTLI